MVDFRGPNGDSPPSTSSQASNPNPAAIEPGHWARAENAAQRIIWRVQPTLVSDERRREVIGYVQRLFRNLLGCEVFPYGSVPLKTYLPDGDIDLTAFGGASEEDYLANGMVSILEGEDQSRALEFVVKDIQLVRAEVKLLKCIINDVVVDISFNQIGGLCTLCFLEQVDCLIGKDHLFKRSIILIKAWCYYESRILGAHHGLISTYALETLVLYIFHLFHSTLSGPLQVLYKFLDYFSKFDWENYCVSLTGPVRLPDLVAEVPENGGGDLLLSSDFLRYCTEMFSVPSRGFDPSSRTFQPKHLNIVDPLKEANNLGRSVSKGNFYRIRSAFTYGARKLGRVLLQPEDDIADGLSRFFSNTLDRHGSGQRPDVEVARPLCATSGLESNEAAEEGTPQQHHETRDALDFRLIVDARDLAQLSGLHSVSPTGAPYPAPHLHISHSVRSNGEKTVDLTLSSKIPNDHTDGVPGDINGRINGHQEHQVSGHSSPLSDLSGHHEHQLSTLKHGRWLYDHVSHMQGLPRHPGGPGPLPPIFHGNNSRDAIHHPTQFRPNGFPHIMGNGPFPNPALYAVNPVIVPPAAFGLEDVPKPRGTGTYFPIMGRLPQPPRPPVMKGGSHGNLRSPRHFGRHPMFMETNMVDHISPEFLHPSVSGNQSGAPRRPSRPPHSFPLEERGQPHRNGPDGGFEMNQQDRGRHWRQRAVSCAENASPVSPSTDGTENLKPVSSGDHDRVSVESSYHLKDEDDFPPLPL